MQAITVSPQSVYNAFVEPLLFSTRKPMNGQQCVSLRQCEHRVAVALLRRLAI